MILQSINVCIQTMILLPLYVLNILQIYIVFSFRSFTKTLFPPLGHQIKQNSLFWSLLAQLCLVAFSNLHRAVTQNYEIFMHEPPLNEFAIT